jgi:hypothetical protein
LAFGEKASVNLGTNDYYWYFFELDSDTKVALECSGTDTYFEVSFGDESEPIANVTTYMWSRTLSGGKYYVKIVCTNGNMFGTILIELTLFNLQELPDLPIGSEFSLDQQAFNPTKEAYYRVDIDKDSNINVQTYKHPDLRIEIRFYYSINNSRIGNLVFDYSDDFAVFEQSTSIDAGECIVWVQYRSISANPKKPNISKTANLTITITEQNNVES